MRHFSDAMTRGAAETWASQDRAVLSEDVDLEVVDDELEDISTAYLAALDEIATLRAEVERLRDRGLDCPTEPITAVTSGSRVEGEAVTSRCQCDFCTGRKRHEDNWCPRCAEVRMQPPKWWENLDVCDNCEKAIDAARSGEGE